MWLSRPKKVHSWLLFKLISITCLRCKWAYTSHTGMENSSWKVGLCLCGQDKAWQKYSVDEQKKTITSKFCNFRITEKSHE